MFWTPTHRPSSPPRLHLVCRPGTLLVVITVLFAAAISGAGPASADQVFRLDGVDVLRLDSGWHARTAGDSTRLPLHGDATVHRAIDSDGGVLVTATMRSDEARSAGSAGRRLALLRVGADGAIEELPTPTVTDDQVLGSPTPLVDIDGALRQMLWIEGQSPTATRVLAATWAGSGWSAPVEISGVGPGTQIALDAVVLVDGTWLAAWARYDGEDDEIQWSRFVDGAWSKAAAMTANDVPDVTPALLATDEGALLAWSGFDGAHYRIHLARLQVVGAIGGWSRPEILPGLGTVWPAFQTLGDGPPVLSWRQAKPRAWQLAEVAADGTIGRRALATVTPATLGRPVLLDRTDEGLVLTWDANALRARSKGSPSANEASKVMGQLAPWLEALEALD